MTWYYFINVQRNIYIYIWFSYNNNLLYLFISIVLEIRWFKRYNNYFSWLSNNFIFLILLSFSLLYFYNDCLCWYLLVINNIFLLQKYYLIYVNLNWFLFFFCNIMSPKFAISSTSWCQTNLNKLQIYIFYIYYYYMLYLKYKVCSKSKYKMKK